LAGHVIVGGVVSRTKTVKKQSDVLPEPSVAVHVTKVTPIGNTEPDGGVQATVVPGQLLLAVGVV
jgi:hypothetical protein